MRLLLDTHALLWFVLNDGKLSRAVDAIISDPTNEVFVSPATFWELAIKVRTKKLDLLSPYDDFIRNGIVGNDFIVLPIEAKHTSLFTDMPFHHKDPFDRILIAQALVEGISLISIDSIFDQYGVTRIW